MKKTSKILALALALCMVLGLSAFASGEASGGMAPPPGGGGSSEPDSYDAVLNVTADQTIDGVSMVSDTGDQNIIHVMDGATAYVTNSSFVNGGDSSSGDGASFYGVGSTLFVSDGTLYAQNDTIESTGSGCSGVFAYKDGVAYVSGLDIHTTKAAAGGLHVAGGGTLYAWDCNIETEAPMAAAAIRSDRGGGTMVVDGGRYITAGGTGAVYVTADISVHDAYLYAGGSEGVAIEGKNSIRLFDCDLTCNMLPGEINDGRVWNLIVYQSMSGDADVGTSEYDMIGGTLTCNAGPVVYNTNTSSYITFKDVDVVRSDATTYFLQVTGNASSRTWGRAGANGANCIFSAYSQKMDGDVVYDTISNLDMYLMEGSVFTGALTCDDSLNGGNSGDGITNLTIDAGSVWNVTGNSYVSGMLSCAGTIQNAYIMDVNGNYLGGTGEYVVYVGGYQTAADVSAAGQVPVWEDYAVANPFKTASASGEASAQAPASAEPAAQAPASGEASAQPAQAASGESMSVQDAFIEYIHQWLIAEDAINDTMTEEIRENEFMPLVRQMNFTDFPAEMIYSGMLESGVPMTFEEFAAQY